jgi:hypothetical protein
VTRTFTGRRKSNGYYIYANLVRFQRNHPHPKSNTKRIMARTTVNVRSIASGGSPEESNQTIRIPGWKGNGQTDIANGEDGQGICHRPKSAGEDSPDDQMRPFEQVPKDIAGALEEDGQGPPRYEDPKDHAK